MARNAPLSTQNEKRSARCHCKRRCVSCPSPGRATVLVSAFVRPNRTTFMSGKCLIFCFACGVRRVPVRRARLRSTDVEFDQPKPTQPRLRSTPHTGGAIERRRGAQRPAGARGANASLKHRTVFCPDDGRKANSLIHQQYFFSVAVDTTIKNFWTAALKGRSTNQPALCRQAKPRAQRLLRCGQRGVHLQKDRGSAGVAQGEAQG